MSKALAMNPPREYFRMPHWMWIMHVGVKSFCEWRSDEWPYTCSSHIWGHHVRDGEQIAGYCKHHVPEGLPVINGSTSWCAECDRQAVRLDYDGVWRCDTHGRMNPVNHLAKMESGNPLDMLRTFTDEQLQEQSAWLKQEEARYRAEEPDGKRYGNQYAAYRMTVTDSTVWRVWRERHEGAPLG